jgi:polysaccharide deacetylase 2 family uncharacterized protein YibQ
MTYDKRNQWGSSSLRRLRRPIRSTRWSRLPAAGRWFFVLLVISFFNATAVAFLWTHKAPHKENRPAAVRVPPKKITPISLSDFKKQVFAVFKNHQVPKSWVTFREISSPKNDSLKLEFVVKYPTKFQKDWLTNDLFQTFSAAGWQVVRARSSLKHPNEDFVFVRPTAGRLTLRLVRYPKIEWHDRQLAIIIDDFGYKLGPSISEFLALPAPVTWAIIPGLPHTKEVAEIAQKNHVPTIIHLPMQPLRGKIEQDGMTIMVGMSEKQIATILEKARMQVPMAEGVNNHMGSLLTTHQPTLIRLMRVLRKDNLFFIDSMTNPESIAYKIARNQGVPSMKMFTYLDNPKSGMTLAEKMAEAVKEADRKGPTIVIGHDRLKTVKELAPVVARWKAKGIYFVPVRELVQEYWQKRQYLRKTRLFR